MKKELTQLIAYRINKKRDVFLELVYKENVGRNMGGCWMRLTKREILALAEKVKEKDFEVENWNVQALAKEYKTLL